MRSLKCGTGFLVLAIAGCPVPDPQPREVILTVDFNDGPQGWVPGVSDYSVAEADGINFDARIAILPQEIFAVGRGYFMTSNNPSDDVFMFLKRQLGEAERLVPNQSYSLEYTVRLASNAQSNCFGVGGAQGESVFLKVGGATIQPEALDPDDSGFIVLNVDKGNQGTSGPAATVIGDIANGDECDDPRTAPYVSIVRSGTHAFPVTTDENAKLWLLVGTDSGFEGVTTIFYQVIQVTLTPVATSE